MKKLKLKHVYDSVVDDVYNDFFNAVLSKTRSHMRFGGVFTSYNFAACAEGMQDFIMNDGKMELILMPSFSKKDVEAIYDGISNNSKIITDNWIVEIEQIKDKFRENHVKALAWLLKNNLLEIKLIIVKDKNNKILNHEGISNIKLLDRKFGIFLGEKTEEIISFQGEITRDDQHMGEHYHIDVFKYWNEDEKKWVNEHFKEFRKYWTNEKLENIYGYNIDIISLPDAIRNSLLQIAPESKSQINLDFIKLRPYQKIACKNWFDNNCKGIFEMATGTGKTITGLNAAIDLIKKYNNLIIVITCPTTILVEQWKKILRRLKMNVIIVPEEKNWNRKIDEYVYLNNKNSGGVITIITTYDTFCTDKFIQNIQKSIGNILLISDEVHRAGSIEAQKGLIPQYKFRLGLTATLERYFDEKGTNVLLNYFDKTVFEYDLKNAIDKNMLVGYYYYPIYLHLTEDEYLAYVQESKIIAMYYNSEKFEHIKILESALRRRSNIIKNAENKMKKFTEFVKNNPDLKHAIIFCSDKQISVIPNILLTTNKKPIRSRRITYKTPKNDRQTILDQLSNEDYEAVVAMQVLDEGVDIPQAKNCILLSNTGNPKQFIQRRGRVLRKFFGKYKDGSEKKYAKIYDFLILPQVHKNMSEKEKNIEKRILQSQINRHYKMSNIAINAEESQNEISTIAKQLGLTDY